MPYCLVCLHEPWFLQTYVRVVPGAHAVSKFDPVASEIGDGLQCKYKGVYVGELWTAQVICFFTCKVQLKDCTVKTVSLAIVQWLDGAKVTKANTSRLADMQETDRVTGFDTPYVDVIETDRIIAAEILCPTGEMCDMAEYSDPRDFGKDPISDKEIFTRMRLLRKAGHRFIADPSNIQEWADGEPNPVIKRQTRAAQ